MNLIIHNSQLLRRSLFALFWIPLVGTSGAGCQVNETGLGPDADGSGGADASSTDSDSDAGGAPPLCGGCAVLTVPAAEDDLRAALMITRSALESFDLSDTVVTFRFWVESNAKNSFLTFYIFNEYKQPTGESPMISVDFASNNAVEPVELSLDLSELSAMGGAGSMNEAQFGDVRLIDNFDAHIVQGIGMLVSNVTAETIVYLDSVTFSTNTVPNITFDTSSEHAEAFQLLRGIQSELTWIP